MVALAHAEIAGPGIEVRIEALMSEPHLRVQESSPRHRSATGAGAFLPVVHVVLLQAAGRADPPQYLPTGSPPCRAAGRPCRNRPTTRPRSCQAPADARRERCANRRVARRNWGIRCRRPG